MFVYEEEIFEYWGSFFDYVISNNLHPITVETDNGEVVTFDKDGNININVPDKDKGYHWFKDFVSCKVPAYSSQNFDELVVNTEDDKLHYVYDTTVENILNEYRAVKTITAILDDNTHVYIWVKGKGD